MTCAIVAIDAENGDHTLPTEGLSFNQSGGPLEKNMKAPCFLYKIYEHNGEIQFAKMSVTP